MSPKLLTILQFRWEAAGKPQDVGFGQAPTASGHMEPATMGNGKQKHTSLRGSGVPGTFARIAGHGQLQMSTLYLHEQKMESSGWWANGASR